MAASGSQVAWTLTRFLLGFLLWCVAGLFVFVLFDGSVPVWAAITLAALVMLGLPTLFTRLLIPAFARLGEKPRWIELWPGLCAVVALLALVGTPLLGRALTARKLGAVSRQHAHAPPWVRRMTDTLARWLAPADAANGPSTVVHGDAGRDGDASETSVQDGASAPDAEVGDDTADAADAADDGSFDGSLDGSVDEDADASAADGAPDANADDASVTDANGSGDAVVDLLANLDDAGDGDDPDDGEQDAAVADVADAPPVDPHSRQSGLREFAQLQPCSWMRSVWMGELALGGTDEIVLSCANRVQVFFVQNDALVERTVFAPRTPAGQQLMLSRPLIADIDGDGRRDLGLCAYFTSERGGVRGGNVWWARGGNNGQFEAPRALVGGGVDCAGIEFGDVTGDGRPELLIVKENNGYAATNRDSELLWYSGQGTQWTQRGRVRLARGASSIWLEDLTRDGILDAIVHTGWDGERRNWVIAGARRGPTGVVNVEDAGSEAREFLHAQGRLDGDRVTDVARIENQRLVLWRSSDDGRAVRTSSSRALDFEQFEF